MSDRLDEPGRSNQDADWRRERRVAVERAADKRTRRRPIEAMASDGFGLLQQTQTTSTNRSGVPGACNAGDFWRRSVRADKN
jgi:hypothetical protein